MAGSSPKDEGSPRRAARKADAPAEAPAKPAEKQPPRRKSADSRERRRSANPSPEPRSDHRRRDRHEGRLRDLARRILTERERPPRDAEEPGDQEREGYVPHEAAKDALGAILETGDRAKTEMVRMVAREVRTYLSELKLGEELNHMLRNYKLEVNASFALKPLNEEQSDGEAQPGEADDEEELEGSDE